MAVQLAPWDKNKKRGPDEIAAVPVDSDWAELREAQSMAARVMKKVGLAVITDAGDKDAISAASTFAVRFVPPTSAISPKNAPECSSPSCAIGPDAAVAG